MKTPNRDPGETRRRAPGALFAAAILFVVFVGNIVIGKTAVMAGATVVPGLGDVGEFLVLFAAVVLFIVACLVREGADNARK